MRSSHCRRGNQAVADGPRPGYASCHSATGQGVGGSVGAGEAAEGAAGGNVPGGLFAGGAVVAGTGLPGGIVTGAAGAAAGTLPRATRTPRDFIQALNSSAVMFLPF